ATLVKDLYSDLYQEMETEGVAFWSETAIPNHVFRALVDYVAGHSAPDFGRIEYVVLARDGEARLRRISSEEHNGETVATVFY
ncbi:MAG: hypothetical protein WAT93_07370, partial [Pontixanthobacter sp.]